MPNHLKHFSFFNLDIGCSLTSACNFLSSTCCARGTEELALALNGKKRKIRLSDFRVVILASGLAEKVIANMEKKFRKVLPKWFETIGASF